MKPGVISKTFTILRAFTDEKSEWGVNELARYLKMPVSSVHRLLATLKIENILEFSDQTEKYRMGSEFIRMSSIVSNNVDMKRYARPYIEELATRIPHSVYLALYNPQHKKLAFVDSIQGSQGLQYVLEIGVLQPIHIAASGKNILANLDQHDISEIIDREIEDDASKSQIRAELKKIKNEGYAKTFNERKEGALSIGAPIFDASQKVIGSIICVIPIGDYQEENEVEYISNVKSAASNISHLLGYIKK